MEDVRASAERLLSNEGSLLDFEDDVVTVASAVPVLIAALETARIPHFRVLGDPYFDCPIAQREDSDYPEDYADAQCNCVAVKHNAAIDAALAAADRAAAPPSPSAPAVCPECVEDSTAAEHFKSHTATAVTVDPGAGG
jgi:hypothetical protein